MCSRSWRPGTLLMVNCRFLPSVVLTLLVIVESTSAVVYLNKWAVKIHGGLEVANAVAQQNGFRNLGQIGTLENYYLLEQRRIVRRSVNPSIRHHVRLENEPKVTWLEQQTIRRRVKRDVTTRPKNTQYWNDPLWPRMWYLNRGMFNGVDMNVMNAWELGYSGRGVVVTILDDGIEHNHTDLQPNYDPTASWDINSMDDDPMPRYDASDDNRHGTRCAGQVAAVANNSKCTVGVAYRSSIGGIRMLDGDVSDFVEAHALSFNSQHIDIYSASWGPEDNGKVIEGPATLARQAFLQGVTKGRRGLGSIYIWASGNGGSRSDSCSCDGYTNSVYTLSVSSTSEHGTKPWYLEECSSTLAATYSSGENYRDRKIVTTDLHNRCTDDHTGTSASAPLAAGICALALEANPELTWRDMQHIVILSARTEPLKDAHWVTNGVKRKVSHRYGYGLMDAYSMVQLAERWTTVPEQRICATDLIVVNHTLERRGASFEVSTNGCFGSANEINFLEHVQAKVTLNYSRRGDLQLYLVSPSGTRSTLFPRRKDDFQAGKLDAWPFLSVFYWGENPNGTWTLTAENGGSILNSGLFESWQLIFYGTETRPVNLTNSPVYRTKSPPLPITPVVPVKNDTSLVDGDARSNILDNNTMLNATHVEPVTLKTASASSSMSSINSQGSLQDTTSFTLESTAKTELTTNVPFSSSTEVLVDATFVPEMLLPTIVTSTSPATETVASPSSTSHIEIHSTTESLYPDDQLPSNGSVNCTTGQSGLCNGTSVDSAIEPSSSTSTVTSHTTTDDQAIPSSTKFDIVFDETSTLPVIDNKSSTRTVIESFECDSECSDDGCNGPLSTDCLSCKHAQIADNRQCVSACPSVMFHNQTSGQCQSCPSACDECAVDVTRQFLNCYHCINGHFLLAIDDVTLCVQYCPSSYFADDASGVCTPCSIECSECESSASRCIQCAEGYDMIDFNCFPRCELSEYREQDGSCQQCDSSCVTCVGPLSDDCIQCSEALWYEDGLCVPNCSDGRYSALINDEKFCQMCYPSCLTCFGPNELDCFMCFHPLKLVGTTCVEACPPGFYEIIEEAMCYPCDNNCETCHGPDSDNCLTCHQNLLLHLGQCVARCPSGFFEVVAANETTVAVTSAIFQVNDRSVSYGENTERASNLINSESSSGGLITWGEVGNDNTVSRVVSRTISSGESTGGPSKWCEPCHPTCQQCVDSTESNCTECDEGLLLSRGYCVQQCDQAYYADGQRCERCDPNCEKCDGPSDVDCISCHDGWYLYASFCVTSCPEGFFSNNESRTCQRCQGDCWTCDSQFSCTTCFAPLVLHLQQCTVCCSADDEYIAEDDCCVCDETMSSCLQPTTGGSLTSVTTAPSVAAAERTITPVAETTTSTTSDSVKTTILTANTDVTVILKWPTTASAPSDLSSYSILTMDSSTPVVTTDLTSSTSLPNRTSIVPSPETALPSQSAPLHVALTSVADGDDTDPTRTLPTTVSVEDVALVTRDVITELDRLDEETVADQTTSVSLVTTVTLTSAVPPMVYPLISPWLFVLIAVFVTSSVLLASLVFCLVRARSQHKLCWTKHRCYLPVTLLYHNGTDVHNTAATATLPTKVSTELAPLTPV